jgi:hypothetical protein
VSHVGKDDTDPTVEDPVLGVVWVLVEGMHDAVVPEHLGDDLLTIGFLHQGARVHAVRLLTGAVVG